jgi:putative PIN family toxin of toxin-antitoxin system
VRIVLDTSVVVAALTTPNPQSASRVVLAAVAAGVVQLLVSDELEEEYLRAVNYRGVIRYAARTDRRAFVAAIVAVAERVTAETAAGAVPSDPGDDMVIGTAKGGKADVVVTLDRDLLRLGEVDGVRIVRPGEFLRELS